MDFKADKPIFRQIVDLFSIRILTGLWKEGERIPSVRELSVELMVNTRTVLSALEELEKEGVIASRRGMGYYLEDGAKEKERRRRVEEFKNVKLRELFEDMKALGIGIDEVAESYANYAKHT
ncbi:MAG: GntR family transcriptional regulator [Clostridium sp.]|nr:GntR family transcriptional regulator [Clostridium sp.]